MSKADKKVWKNDNIFLNLRKSIQYCFLTFNCGKMKKLIKADTNNWLRVLRIRIRRVRIC